MDVTHVSTAELRQRAEQGDVNAQYNLGDMYENRRGVPQDYREAVRWYRAAADQGHSEAQNYLGFMYQEGRGVAQDHVQAYLWFDLAASTGFELAIQNRESIVEKMTSEQIAEAQRLAREFKPKSSGSQ